MVVLELKGLWLSGTFFPMVGEINWGNIIEGICIAVGSTVVLALIYRFRRIIVVWLKRRFNRMRRFMKISQSFPRHTLEFCNLIRENRKLSEVNRSMQAEINKTRIQATEKENQLEEAQEKLLIFATYNEWWSTTEASDCLKWNSEFANLVVHETRMAGLISGSSDPYGIYRCHITMDGRRFLFDRGLLNID